MNYNDIYDLFEMRKDPLMGEYTDTKLDETFHKQKLILTK